jgi:hypothetical protein
MDVADQENFFAVIENGTRFYSSAVLIDEQVTHNCENPSLKIGLWCIIIAIGNCFEHGLLGQIPCVFSVSGKRQGKRLQVVF